MIFLDWPGTDVTDPYYGDTILILNCEQPDGSTTFIDTSPVAHTMGFGGGIDITDQFAIFDGVDNYLGISAVSEWDFGTGDFTIEVVADIASLPALWTLITNRSPNASNPDEGFIIIGNSVGLIQAVVWGEPSGGAVVIANLIAASGTASTGVHHICLQRSGTTFTLSYDGVSAVSSTSSDAVGFNSTFGVQIGNDTSLPGRFYNGGMRVRVTKGVARYTFPFTPSFDLWPDPN